MLKNRTTALHALLDNCIASISVVCQKKHQCDNSHIGSITVLAYSDSLGDFSSKYCIDAKMINNCNMYFERCSFPLQWIGELKIQNVFSPLAFNQTYISKPFLRKHWSSFYNAMFFKRHQVIKRLNVAHQTVIDGWWHVDSWLTVEVTHW